MTRPISVRFAQYALLTAFLAASGAGCRGNALDSERASAGPAVPAPAPAPGPAVPAPEASARLDASALELTGRMTLGGQRIDAKIDGRLALASVERGAERWELWALGDSRAHAQTSSGQSRPLVSLRHPFYVLRDPEGNPGKIRVSSELDAVQRRLIETLVGAVRFAVPPEKGDAWKARERDNLGWHEARYRRAKDGSVERQKGAYERITQQLAWTVRESAWRARFEGKSLTELEGNESVFGKAEPLSVDYTVEVKLRRTSEPVAVAARALDAIPESYVEFEFGRSSQKSDREKDEFVAKGIELAYVEQALAVRVKGGPSWEQIYTSAAYLRLHPADIEKVVEVVRRDPESLANAVSILGQTATAEAQQRLVTWMRELRATAPDKAAAILEDSMRRVEKPGEPLVTYLLAGSAEPPSEAQRTFIDAAALAIERVRDAGDARAAEWTGRLLELSRQSAHAVSRGQYLASLGRIRDPRCLQELLDQSGAAEPMVRSGAIAGLGTNADPLGQQRLLQLATTDGDAELRAAALEAMTFEGVKTHRSELFRAFRAEKAEVVRVVLARTLGRLVRLVPEVRAPLSRARDAERNERVRVELQRAIEKAG